MKIGAEVLTSLQDTHQEHQLFVCGVTMKDLKASPWQPFYVVYGQWAGVPLKIPKSMINCTKLEWAGCCESNELFFLKLLPQLAFFDQHFLISSLTKNLMPLLTLQKLKKCLLIIIFLKNYIKLETYIQF